MERREFLKSAGIGLGVLALPGLPRKKETVRYWAHPDGSYVKLTINDCQGKLLMKCLTRYSL